MLIVKIGGGKDINWDYVCSDLKPLLQKERVVLVHGANKIRDDLAKELKVPTKYITAPSGHKGVFTDKKALEILVMAYAGLANKTIVATLQQSGINAVGLSGADGRIWECVRKTNLLSIENGKTKLIKDTFTGKVDKVNTTLIHLLVDNGFVPVITQPAISHEGELINTDNDRNIAIMARDLKATKLVVLFEAPGLLANSSDESSLIQTVAGDNITETMNKVNGRMSKKMLGAKEALEAGVKTIYWGDVRIKNPITSALAGKGTVIT